MKIYSTLLLLLLLPACSSRQEKAPEEQEAVEGSITFSEEQMRHAGIRLDTLRQIAAEDLVQANGIVDVPPQGYASVSAPMAGYIQDIEVLPGQLVHKGEVLAILRNSAYIDLQQELVKETGKLRFAQIELERNKELVANKVGAEKELQQAQADYISQQSLVNALTEKVKLLGLSPAAIQKGTIYPVIQLVSPIHGYVKASSATIGKFSSPETVLFEITDISHMHLELQVFEKDLLKVKKGQLVSFRSASGNGAEDMQGKVFLLGKNLDPASRTAGIHVHFDEEKHSNLLPGMFISATIHTGLRQIPALPDKALIRKGKETAVFYTTSSSSHAFQKMVVVTGKTAGEFTEITNSKDLKGKFVVTEGAYYLNAELSKPEEE